MPKAKTKIVILEGTTELSNAELVKYLQDLFDPGTSGEMSDFTLTQKPKVQVAQQPKAK